MSKWVVTDNAATGSTFESDCGDYFDQSSDIVMRNPGKPYGHNPEKYRWLTWAEFIRFKREVNKVKIPRKELEKLRKNPHSV